MEQIDEAVLNKVGKLLLEGKTKREIIEETGLDVYQYNSVMEQFLARGKFGKSPARKSREDQLSDLETELWEACYQYRITPTWALKRRIDVMGLRYAKFRLNK